MTRWLIFAVIVSQFFLYCQLRTISKYTQASFAIHYFGVDDSTKLAQYLSLKDRMTSNPTEAKFKIQVDSLGRPSLAGA